MVCLRLTRQSSSHYQSFQSCWGTRMQVMAKGERKSTSQVRRTSLGLPKGYLDANRYTLVHEQLSGIPKQIEEKKPFVVLGIETSCDDTGVGVVTSSGKVLSNVVYKQTKIHENFGGVVPSLAMESHKSKIDIAVEEAVAKANLPNGMNDIDAIAVTKGPGLEICLRVGLEKAKKLASDLQKPFVAIHHLEAHALIARMMGEVMNIKQLPLSPALSAAHPTTFVPSSSSSSSSSLEQISSDAKVAFPFLTLLTSGGHTALLLCHGIGQYQFLGGTLDDSVGEALDKAARMLGLQGYNSGGQAIEAYTNIFYEKYFDTRRPQGIKIPTDVLYRKHGRVYNPFFVTGKEGEMVLFHHRMVVPLKRVSSEQLTNGTKRYDFSFAGLKSQFRKDVEVARTLFGLDPNCTNAPAGNVESTSMTVSLPEDISSYLAAAFEDIVFTHIEDRLVKVLDELDTRKVDINGIVVVGGVAANQHLRSRLAELLLRREMKSNADIFEESRYGYNPDDSSRSSDLSQPPRIPLIFPPPALCTDNGVMVAWAGIEKLRMGISNQIDGQEPFARWPLGNVWQEFRQPADE